MKFSEARAKVKEIARGQSCKLGIAFWSHPSGDEVPRYESCIFDGMDVIFHRVAVDDLDKMIAEAVETVSRYYDGRQHIAPEPEGVLAELDELTESEKVSSP